MHAGGDQARDVRHVDDHHGADGFGDDRDSREVDHARIGARAHHDHRRLVLVRESLEFLVVDPLIVFADPVRDDVVQLAGEVERMTVREVAAVGQVHAQHRVARLYGGEVHRHVGLRARVRLHVRVLGAEQLLGSGDRERLGDIHELAPAVIAPARIALRRTCSSSPNRLLRAPPGSRSSPTR